MIKQANVYEYSLGSTIIQWFIHDAELMQNENDRFNKKRLNRMTAYDLIWHNRKSHRPVKGFCFNKK